MRDLNHDHVLNADLPARDPSTATIPRNLLAQNPPARAVALYLALDAWPFEEPFRNPSVAVLAERLDVAANTARAALAWLIDRGWVYRYDQHRPDGGYTTPLFVVNADPFPDLEPTADRWLILHYGGRTPQEARENAARKARAS